MHVAVSGERVDVVAGQPHDGTCFPKGVVQGFGRREVFGGERVGVARGRFDGNGGCFGHGGSSEVRLGKGRVLAQRSRTRRAERERETQGSMQSLAARSCSASTESRWSGVPSTTGVRQVPQVPCSQEDSTSAPACRTA